MERKEGNKSDIKNDNWSDHQDCGNKQSGYRKKAKEIEGQWDNRESQSLT